MKAEVTKNIMHSPEKKKSKKDKKEKKNRAGSDSNPTVDVKMEVDVDPPEIQDQRKQKKEKKKKKKDLDIQTEQAEENGIKESIKKDKKEKRKKKTKDSEDSGIENTSKEETTLNGDSTSGAVKSDSDEEQAEENGIKGSIKKDKKEKRKKKIKDSEDSGIENTSQEETALSGAVKSDSNEEAGKTEAQIEGDFRRFRISETTIQKLKERGVQYLFPIQYKTFDYIYDGKDVMAQARTGTGKTFSFAIPLVEKLSLSADTTRRGRPPKVVVLAPTRELAKQVATDFESITDKLSILCVYGGTPYSPQESSIRRGIDVMVGTPGRVLDFLEKGTLRLDEVDHCVLDEVDQMLDMGFAESVEAILKYAYEGRSDHSPQTLLFSATMPPWVHKTSQKYMKGDVQRVDLIGTAELKTALTVQHLAIKCSYHDRAATIGDIMQVYSGNHGRAIIFCQTKRDADELTMSSAVKQETHVMHGDIPQEKREKVLKKFREGRYKCLITTDVAARGLDIPEVDLVIQCAPPKDVDSYIHRSGRTGRAGRAGTCVCFYKPQEEMDLRKVENRAGIKFKKIGPPTPEDIIQAAAKDAARAIETISAETLAHYQRHAEELIEQRGAVTALSAALALISGSTEIKARSLLSAKEGFTTYLFRTNMEMRGLGYAWTALARHIPQEAKDQITRMRFCADKMGCVFDLPTELESVVEDHWKDETYNTLTKATELPELLEYEDWGNKGSFGGRSSWGGGGDRRGGGFRGRGRGEGRGSWGRGRGQGGDRGRGGNRGRGGQRGGFKRSFGGDSSFGETQAKRTKFDD